MYGTNVLTHTFRSINMQKEVANLKAYLKVAKRRLKVSNLYNVLTWLSHLLDCFVSSSHFPPAVYVNVYIQAYLSVTI